MPKKHAKINQNLDHPQETSNPIEKIRYVLLMTLASDRSYLLIHQCDVLIEKKIELALHFFRE